MEETARRHQRLQQALVDAVRAGQEPDPEAQAELAWFARQGMSEAEALAYLLRKYPVPVYQPVPWPPGLAASRQAENNRISPLGSSILELATRLAQASAGDAASGAGRPEGRAE